LRGGGGVATHDHDAAGELGGELDEAVADVAEDKEFIEVEFRAAHPFDGGPQPGGGSAPGGGGGGVHSFNAAPMMSERTELRDASSRMLTAKERSDCGSVSGDRIMQK
jgi:hypothetical protein